MVRQTYMTEDIRHVALLADSDNKISPMRSLINCPINLKGFLWRLFYVLSPWPYQFYYLLRLGTIEMIISRWYFVCLLKLLTG